MQSGVRVDHSVIEELRKSEIAVGGFVQRTLHEAFGIAGQPSALHSSGDHFMCQLFCRRSHQVVRLQLQFFKQRSDRLHAQFPRLISFLGRNFIGHLIRFLFCIA